MINHRKIKVIFIEYCFLGSRFYLMYIYFAGSEAFLRLAIMAIIKEKIVPKITIAGPTKYIPKSRPKQLSPEQFDKDRTRDNNPPDSNDRAKPVNRIFLKTFTVCLYTKTEISNTLKTNAVIAPIAVKASSDHPIPKRRSARDTIIKIINDEIIMKKISFPKNMVRVPIASLSRILDKVGTDVFPRFFGGFYQRGTLFLY